MEPLRTDSKAAPTAVGQNRPRALRPRPRPRRHRFHEQPQLTNDHGMDQRGPNRFLKLTWPWYGQLANQLVTIAKAYTLASCWNRTLVIPPLAPNTDQYPLDRLDPFDLFAAAALRNGPVAVLSLKQYQRYEIPLTSERCPRNSCLCCSRRPRCDCGPGTDAEARTLLLDPKTTFLGNAGNDMNCSEPNSLFRWLEPAPLIAQEVRPLVLKLSGGGSGFLGIHLRRLKPTEDDAAYCARKLAPMGRWYTEARGIPWYPTGQECYMPPALVNCYRHPTSQPIFLGTDGRNTVAMEQLSGLGAVRFTPSSAFGPLRAVLVDLFVLAQATTFVGHPLSTFSAVVCSLREARGLSCPNLLPKLRPSQCQRLPDTTLAFESYARSHRPRVSVSNGVYLRPCNRPL